MSLSILEPALLLGEGSPGSSNWALKLLLLTHDHGALASGDLSSPFIIDSLCDLRQVPSLWTSYVKGR